MVCVGPMEVQVSNPWREAVDEQLMLCEMVASDDPRESLSRLLDWHVHVATKEPLAIFRRGDRVRKMSGSEWVGRIVGRYSTDLTPSGYAVESEAHRGSVQIYPAAALELVP